MKRLPSCLIDYASLTMKVHSPVLISPFLLHTLVSLDQNKESACTIFGKQKHEELFSKNSVSKNKFV